MLGWLGTAVQHPQGSRGLASAATCAVCVLVTFYCTSTAHSLVLMSAAWVSVFALCSVLASLHSMTISHKPMDKFSYGMARVPVLTVFSSTVLAQLFSIFLSKESFEHLLAPDHHGSGGHDHDGGHGDHSADSSAAWPFFVGALSSFIALLVAAYSLKNQPFQHVLTAATSSSLQEHAADVSHAICWAVPGLSRLLLPRINAMVLLAVCTSTLVLLCENFRAEFPWADPVCCVTLSLAVFSTMWPLSTYTGRILLQTAPPHLLNQLDRCISEASTIDGVLELRAGHFWQLDFSQMVGTVDVRVRRDADEQSVLALVSDKLSAVVSILTVQVVKDAAWQSQDTMALYGGSVSLNPAQHNQNAAHDHDDHGHSHDGGSHGHSHDGHGHSHDSHNANHDAYGFSMEQSPITQTAYHPPQQPAYYQQHVSNAPDQMYGYRGYAAPTGQAAYGPGILPQSSSNHGHSHEGGCPSESGGHGHSHEYSKRD